MVGGHPPHQQLSAASGDESPQLQRGEQLQSKEKQLMTKNPSTLLCHWSAASLQCTSLCASRQAWA